MFLSHPIPESVRKTYNKSFLYNAAINLSFLNIEDWSTKEIFVKQYLSDKGWTQAEEQYRTNDGVMMSKENSVILISPKTIILSISKPDYKGFGSIDDIISLTDLLKVMGVENVLNIFLSKINRYMVKKSLEESPEKTMKLLFSPSFIENYDDATGIITISDKHLLMFSVRRESQEDVAVINYILTISKSDEFAVDTVIPELNKMNEKMFSAWRWSVSDNVIKMMEKGDAV